MKKFTCTVAARLPLVLFVAVLAACSDGDPEPLTAMTDSEALLAHGAKKARICTGCHGPNGISRIPANPSLAGLSQEYLSEQLKAFRGGDRQNATMNAIARNLTDTDIAGLSHYFAGLPGPNRD